jgi:short-subunit dehydrogenase
MPAARPLAVVTGASTGIGYELAEPCADHGSISPSRPTSRRSARHT